MGLPFQRPRLGRVARKCSYVLVLVAGTLDCQDQFGDRHDFRRVLAGRPLAHLSALDVGQVLDGRQPISFETVVERE